jgi:hypothetical protein
MSTGTRPNAESTRGIEGGKPRLKVGSESSYFPKPTPGLEPGTLHYESLICCAIAAFTGNSGRLIPVSAGQNCPVRDMSRDTDFGRAVDQVLRETAGPR